MMMISDRADSYEWVHHIIISSKHERDAAPKRPQIQTKSRLEMKMESMEFESHPYRDTGIQ